MIGIDIKDIFEKKTKKINNRGIWQGLWRKPLSATNSRIGIMNQVPELNSILMKKYILLSVVGFHAGESGAEIFARKKREIVDAGKSFWLIKSFKAKTEDIQKFCKCALSEGEEVFCLFLEASQKGGAQPTKTSSLASQFSSDNIHWSEIPKEIRVTGKIDKNTTALVLESLETNNKKGIKVDLWNYSDFLDKSSPVRFMQGASTICAIKKYNEGMKSRYREVVAFGKLTEPFAVWLK